MIRSMAAAIALTLAATVACFFVYFLQRDALAEQVPIHWNMHFEPDKWVPRQDAIWYFLIFPGVMALVIVLTFVLPWLSPKQFEIDRFRGVFTQIMTIVVAMFGLFLALQLWSAYADHDMPGQLLVAGLFLFFALLGNLMGKVQRNFWVGVRTPWTLASDAVWIRTHRLAAWLWVATGVAGFVAALVRVPFLILFIGIIALALYPVLYSLFLYKKLERQGKL